MFQKINEFRRKLTKIVTSGIKKNSYILPNSSIRKILIIRTNHRLGNILLITPLIEEVTIQFPDAEIDLFVKGRASEFIFEKHPKIKNILFLPKKHFSQIGLYLLIWLKLIVRKYDLIINAQAGSSSGKLATKLSHTKFKFYGIESPNIFTENRDYQHYAKNIVYNFRAYLLKSGFKIELKKVPGLRLVLSKDEIFNGLQVLTLITRNNKKTIGFFTYATGGKCYESEFWNELYLKMNTEFGENFNLVEILPIENSSKIDFKSKNYYSKDIREIVSVLSNVELFIGADSGMMHLAASVTKTIGLFKGNYIQKYAPYDFLNQGIDTSKSSVDKIIEVMNSKLCEIEV